ncbi:hypothetical protein [Wenjunlia tyrosinilytica]|uniref:Uncharacterized protein n=1 Tax=Wenjunlia tyrosinilytica TaxID=1544741 RepID=A0A917ZNA3_9ACTN|nr:hypothetical protein [Wenjunlia tyrosinilytica]GGO86639.1 hypothetical protein GCM10012280_23240 [Wenjunlia tyrosinilytica]
MADNDYDPAGSTQMFRAFVDEGATSPEPSTASGGRTGVIVGVAIAVVVVLAAVVWLALK